MPTKQRERAYNNNHSGRLSGLIVPEPPVGSKEKYIEKIRAYIRRTGIKYDFSTPYQMSLSETLELARMSKEDASGAICLAFEYGRAKGERSARAALKKLR